MTHLPFIMPRVPMVLSSIVDFLLGWPGQLVVRVAKPHEETEALSRIASGRIRDPDNELSGLPSSHLPFIMPRVPIFFSLLAFALWVASSPVQSAEPSAWQFNRDIRPILSEACLHCHGPDKSHREGDLRLDVRDDLLRNRDGHQVIVPQKPELSELIRRITSADADERMPPPKAERQLTKQQIETLRQWVAQGAPFESHWAFEPVKAPPLPEVKDQAWAREPLDRFVLDRLERAGLQPNPEADRLTLLRRAALDLTGLPPSPAEVDAALSDTSPRAYERYVDRLLASAHFGERMAVPWLDAARYADTNGYQTDGPRYMWRWRDWVIEAFNRNLPFDQFTIEQLAGDLLPQPTLEQLIATGFNRNHRANAEGGIIAEEFRIEYVVDRVDTTATVWLGLTMGCARCHDHKYDPISQREYYQLFAFFNNVPELGKVIRDNNSPPMVQAPTAEIRQQMEKLQRSLHDLQRQSSAELQAFLAGQSRWESTLSGVKDEFWSPPAQQLFHAPLDGQAKIVDGPGGFVSGRIGKAVQLADGAWVDLGDVGDFKHTERFSLGAWVWLESPDGTIVSRMEDDFNHKGYDLHVEHSKLQFELSGRLLDDAIRIETVEPLPMRRWVHVLATYDGREFARGVTLYVDGLPQPTRVILDTLSNASKNTQPLRVGTRGEGPKLRGLVDDVRLFNRDLDAETVAAIACGDPISAVATIAPSQRSLPQRSKLQAYYIAQHAPTALHKLLQATDEAREQVRAFDAKIPTVMVMQEMSEPRKAHVLLRGEYDKLGEPVTADTPAALGSLPKGPRHDRLELARWLVDRNNPLTARVTVNRFWQQLFGLGLVKTPEDFGSQGEPPLHVELLDHLATQFMEHGWDVKRLLRSIVTSSTYRQSSQASAEQLARDPDNRLLGRGARFRLSAETIRDQALCASGLLDRRIGGPSVKPYQPEGLWEEVAATIVPYVQDHGADLYRRGMYTFWKRTVAPPSMVGFDAAGREACVVRTARTNTPLQALNLLNDVAFVEATRVLAQRAMQSSSALDERITRMFRALLVRSPRDVELRVLRRSFERQLARYRAEPDAAQRLLSFGESPRDERLDRAEHAAYTAVAGVILNLDEAITRE